jgi:hypothetical protein
MQLRAVLRLETYMAPDDRIFEKALARQLRSTPHEETPGRRSECADAETLAAYHERLLAPGELNAFKEHIAGCPRCQEILAQLEATDEIPLSVAGSQSESDRIVVMQPAPIAATVPAGSQPVAKPPRPISSATKRWIVPAGALAAGLLVWVVWQEGHLQKTLVRPSAPTTISENRRAESMPAQPPNSRNAAPVADDGAVAKLEAHPVPALTAPRREAPRGSVSGDYAAPGRVDELDRDLREQDLSDLRKRAPLKDAFNSKAPGPSNRVQQQSNAANYQYQASADPNETLKQDAPAYDSAGARVVAAPPPAVPKPATAAPTVAGYSGGADKKKSELQEEKALETQASTAAQTVTVDGSLSVLSTASSEFAGLASNRVIPVPGTKVIWRIEDDGRVRRSTNLGETWKVQHTGVNTAVLSGSAPSEKVCWLAGAFGTVAVTEDAGTHWTRHSLPIASPIDRIIAFDAQHAIVTLQSTNIQFETFDSGETWTRLTKK